MGSRAARPSASRASALHGVLCGPWGTFLRGFSKAPLEKGSYKGFEFGFLGLPGFTVLGYFGVRGFGLQGFMVLGLLKLSL